MANLTVITDLALTTAGDGTPSNPGIAAGTQLLMTYNKNNSSSAARIYIAPEYENHTWSDIKGVMTGKDASEYEFESKKTLGTIITRRGRRFPRGILYPRGSYIPYRRRASRR